MTPRDVATPIIQITYAAHTASCTFLLDAEGICRRIVMKPKGKRRESSRTASRCVGAQYVASLDGSAAGGLVEMPRVGASMLFARVDERGRISLVRTGVVTAFESQAAEDPFVDSGTVQTSAPVIHSQREAQRAPRTQRAPREREEEVGDPDYYDASDRTQRIQALRPEDIAAALGHDFKTSEYRAAESEVAPRTTLPSSAGASSTLRNPHREATIEGDDDYAEAGPATIPAPPPSRGMLPRRSDPARGGAAQAWAPSPDSAPREYSSDIQVSRRRRGG